MVIATAPGEGEANSSPMDLPDGGVDAPNLRYFVMALFFIFGGITSLNDVIIPKLKELFTLSFFEASLVQFCFFIAYAVVGIPGARLVKKIGYMRGAVAGLCHHAGRLPVVHSGKPGGALPAVPVRLLHPRDRRRCWCRSLPIR